MRAVVKVSMSFALSCIALGVAAADLTVGAFRLGMTHQEVLTAAGAMKSPTNAPLKVRDAQYATTSYTLAGRQVTLPGSEHLAVQMLDWGPNSRYTFTFAGPKGEERVTSVRREDSLTGALPTADGLAARLAEKYGAPSLGPSSNVRVAGNARMMWSFDADGRGRKFTGPAPHQLCEHSKAFSGTPRGYIRLRRREVGSGNGFNPGTMPVGPPEPSVAGKQWCVEDLSQCNIGAVISRHGVT